MFIGFLAFFVGDFTAENGSQALSAVQCFWAQESCDVPYGENMC